MSTCLTVDSINREPNHVHTYDRFVCAFIPILDVCMNQTTRVAASLSQMRWGIPFCQAVKLVAFKSAFIEKIRMYRFYVLSP
jgi:hypothetical protein